MMLKTNGIGLWSRFTFNLELWLSARAIPFLASKNSFSKILNLAEANPVPSYLGLAPEHIEQKIQRTVRHPWLMRNRRCLRIGILGYRFLCKAGYRPELHFGVSPDSITDNQIEAHCWVCLDGRPVIGEPLSDMLTIHVHRSFDGETMPSI